jgi:GT2 family glycosyltransferase
VKLSCVILTLGDRPAELARAVASVRALTGDEVQVVVVGNGADVPPLPDAADLTMLRLASNAGVPAGRNAAVETCTGDVILFLDDDGWYPDPGLGQHVVYRFGADPSLAVLSFRVTGPGGGFGGRWHVPRLRVGDPARSAATTTFSGGACAIRRSAYLEVGGQPGRFFFMHEEIDQAWRLLDRGYRIEYDGAAVMCHPPVPNSRHAGFYRIEARNRVLLARRNLPWPLAALFLLDWLGLTVLRTRSWTAVREWLAGFAAGWRMDPGPRRPLAARTIWRMTRLGRPPVI